MSTRNLDALFRPSSIALIGASKTPSSVGSVLARNLFKSDFDGPVMPVNPKHEAVQGVLTYPDVASLPRVPDLALISTPPETVPGIVAELGARGTKAAAVLTEGFAETGEEGGRRLQQAVLDAAKPHVLRILGPNSFGFIVPSIALNASLGHLPPVAGDIAFVAQPGVMVGAVLDWAAARGIGFSHLVSLGNMADVDFGDMLDHLGLDSDVKAILLYIETVTDARKFMSAARAAARDKPVIVIRGGRYADSGHGVRGMVRVAGSDEVYDAAFQRAGLLRVWGLHELFDAVETLRAAVSIAGDRLAILTNGGGFEVLAMDALVGRGGRLAELAPETVRRLQSPVWPCRSCSNPVVLPPGAPPDRYADALRVLVEAPDADAILVVHGPTPVTSSVEIARAVAEATRNRRKPVLTSWVGEEAVAEARRLFALQRVPTYETPDEASRAFLHMVLYRRNQEILRETPPSLPTDFAIDPRGVRSIIEGVLAEGRPWLTEAEARSLLALYEIPVAAAAGPEQGHGPVAETPVCRPDEYELFVGMAEDPLFGPVIVFGPGGPAFEATGDAALALPPLNIKLARELMERTRVHRQIAGHGGVPGPDLAAVALTLVKVSQLVADTAEIAELRINPLLAGASGVLALGPRIRVARAARPGPARLAIRPYPKELEETITLEGGQRLLLRPVRPEDEPTFRAGFKRLTPEEIRMRFFTRMKGLSHTLAARLTQIDYDREMALILIDPHGPEDQRIWGVVRITADPDRERGEFAVLVPGQVAGRGLGKLLIRRILDYARGAGMREVYGVVLRENTRMLGLCRSLGFVERADPRDYGMVRVVMEL